MYVAPYPIPKDGGYFVLTELVVTFVLFHM